MKRLAIETATRHCQVALELDGRVLARRGEGPRMHAGALLPWIGELLAEAGIGYQDLDALVVDRGPGGFTSLRIGLGVAQGIAIAHELPVHPVSSLAALAAAGAPAGHAGTVLAALDARMGEIYACWFDLEPGHPPELFGHPPELEPGHSPLEPGHPPVMLGGEHLLAPELLDDAGHGSFIAVGDAFEVHAGALAGLAARADRVVADAWPTAEALLALAGHSAPVQAHRVEPVYLRDNVTS